MPSRRTTIHFATQAAISIAALFIVSVMLAAIPAHKSQAPQDSTPQSSQSSTKPATKDMDMNDPAALGAMHAMSGGGHDAHSLHMYMTAPRQQTPEDIARAEKIVAQLRGAMGKYKDYHVALNEGFVIFHPEVPQPEYHFTSHANGFIAAFDFDPAKPTSLLYKKTATGYELVGAMYTMPRRHTEDELNARVPLSVANWHLHTNLCFPAENQGATFDRSKFGFEGSIATEQACDAAGGRFFPTMFGWMVHVYPYESTLDKQFARHDHMHAD
jgi:hypothetical protein